MSDYGVGAGAQAARSTGALFNKTAGAVEDFAARKKQTEYVKLTSELDLFVAKASHDVAQRDPETGALLYEEDFKKPRQDYIEEVYGRFLESKKGISNDAAAGLSDYFNKYRVQAYQYEQQRQITDMMEDTELSVQNIEAQMAYSIANGTNTPEGAAEAMEKMGALMNVFKDNPAQLSRLRARTQNGLEASLKDFVQTGNVSAAEAIYKQYGGLLTPEASASAKAMIYSKGKELSLGAAINAGELGRKVDDKSPAYVKELNEFGAKIKDAGNDLQKRKEVLAYGEDLYSAMSNGLPVEDLEALKNSFEPRLQELRQSGEQIMRGSKEYGSFISAVKSQDFNVVDAAKKWESLSKVIAESGVPIATAIYDVADNFVDKLEAEGRLGDHSAIIDFAQQFSRVLPQSELTKVNGVQEMIINRSIVSEKLDPITKANIGLAYLGGTNSQGLSTLSPIIDMLGSVENSGGTVVLEHFDKNKELTIQESLDPKKAGENARRFMALAGVGGFDIWQVPGTSFNFLAGVNNGQKTLNRLYHTINDSDLEPKAKEHALSSLYLSLASYAAQTTKKSTVNDNDVRQAAQVLNERTEQAKVWLTRYGVVPQFYGSPTVLQFFSGRAEDGRAVNIGLRSVAERNLTKAMYRPDAKDYGFGGAVNALLSGEAVFPKGSPIASLPKDELKKSFAEALGKYPPFFSNSIIDQPQYNIPFITKDTGLGAKIMPPVNGVTKVRFFVSDANGQKQWIMTKDGKPYEQSITDIYDKGMMDHAGSKAAKAVAERILMPPTKTKNK